MQELSLIKRKSMTTTYFIQAPRPVMRRSSMLAVSATLFMLEVARGGFLPKRLRGIPPRRACSPPVARGALEHQTCCDWAWRINRFGHVFRARRQSFKKAKEPLRGRFLSFFLRRLCLARLRRFDSKPKTRPDPSDPLGSLRSPGARSPRMAGILPVLALASCHHQSCSAFDGWHRPAFGVCDAFMLELRVAGIQPEVATTACRRFGHCTTDRLPPIWLGCFFRIMDGTI
ncbi:MAG: hypothetical protein MI861_08775 [Pirellulales bacterium]|nr:hypothetical protein [Pirellulales bacterium]